MFSLDRSGLQEMCRCSLIRSTGVALAKVSQASAFRQSPALRSTHETPQSNSHSALDMLPSRYGYMERSAGRDSPGDDPHH
jgi:hypothetical protein